MAALLQAGPAGPASPQHPQPLQQPQPSRVGRRLLQECTETLAGCTRLVPVRAIAAHKSQMPSNDRQSRNFQTSGQVA